MNESEKIERIMSAVKTVKGKLDRVEFAFECEEEITDSDISTILKLADSQKNSVQVLISPGCPGNNDIRAYFILKIIFSFY